jgi:hypothetical protein
MESIVHFIMSNGTMVITALLGGIIFSVFGLLIMSFHNPKESIAQELGSVDRLEGVLRQMLTDQDWSKGKSEGGAAVDLDQVALLKEQITSLEREVKDKQKQLEHGGGDGSDEGLKEKIQELEARLAEYSIIEEDISDLSKYRQENEELRNRINHVAGIPAAEALTMPWEEFEQIVKNKKAKSAKDDVSTAINPTE